MTVRLGIIMDPIASIKPEKDSSLAMLLAAQQRGWSLHYMELSDLCLRNQRVEADCRALRVFDQAQHWFELGETVSTALAELDVVLMRKDPPFDMEYVYSTYLLEQAEREGLLVVNRPASLRDANEKLFTAWFPQCCPPTLVSRSTSHFRQFIQQHPAVILKPLDGMGGASIFKVTQQDPNLSVILETLTAHGQRYAMAQRFLPEIGDGDKRILMIDGEPVGHALARLPAPGETRGNLAAGGNSRGQELSERDRWICAQLGPTLRERGLLFVGLDVIGDYLTEINVTSPTCIRELDRLFDDDIAARLMDVIADKLAAR